MTNILKAFGNMNNRWADQEQTGVIEATVSAFGSSSKSYTLTLKNGSKITNVSGPAGLFIGSMVVVANYPGKAKRYAILQTSKGSGMQTPTVVSV